MKEIINYYYNFDIDDIEEFEYCYNFLFQRNEYYFVYYNRSIEELDEIIKLSKYLKEQSIDCHEIIINIEKNILTKVGDYNYILLKVTNKDEIFDIFAINEINNKVIVNNNKSKLNRYNWIDLWIKKVDYYEYQIRELGLEKRAIISSFSYYIGLAENAISYANKTISTIPLSNNDRITLSNRRIGYPNIKLNYLNPLSFIYDFEVRNIAEYLKSIFFFYSTNDAFEELISYLKIKKLGLFSYQMLYARLLYPTYYFDIYDQVMNKQKSEDEIIKIIKKVQDYELFLKKAYLEISKYANIEKIDWIINQH